MTSVALRRSILVSTVLVVLCVATGALAETASGALQQLFDESWQFGLSEDPLFATRVGDHSGNDRLPSVAVFDQKRRAKMNRSFRDRLDAIDREALSREEQASYDIFGRLLDDELADFEFGYYLMPITNRSGFHISFPELPQQVPLATVTDYENYLSRLEKFGTYAAQHIELMRQGIRQGLVLPRIVLEGFEETIEPHIVSNPEESLLYAPFAELPDDIDEARARRLRRRAKDAIAQSVVPGYRSFLFFMTDEYFPACREEIGASSLPNGDAFYQHRVRHYTTLDLTPQEIHDKGVAEVARIRAEMEAIIESVGFEGSFEDFLEFLRTDDRFYVDTPEDLMKEVSRVLKKMDGELPRLFRTLPRMPYGIRPVPDFIAPKTTTAYYQRPAGDGSRAGFYFVNTYDLPSRPLYELEALSLHEAVPGHHLQIALMQEQDGLPTFRRFNGFTAFSEGWALYSERLGLEVGFYEDPYNDFGRLTYEMWRACRLVVDTGMHALGWTRQQAIDLLAENSALTLHNITTEVDRYISWPGQALAYKMGELKIRELRARAESELGDRFDLRVFHDVVLGSGAVPLGVLEQNVNAYIESTRSSRG